MEVMEDQERAESIRRLADEAVKANYLGLLEQLIDKIRTVPSLHHLLAVVKCSDNIQDFRVLVHEFLPEFEIQIMSGRTDEDKTALFYRHFEKKYFPLDADATGEYPLEGLTYAIPIMPHGLREDEYHDFTTTSKTRALLSYIVEYPYHYKDQGEGHREALYDYILKEQLARQIDLDNVPRDGWTTKEIATALTGTPYQGMVAFAAWLTKDTGTWWLDCDDEDETEPAQWSADTVEGITEQWQMAREIEKSIGKLELWLKEDMQGNFGRLVDAIQGKIHRRRPKAKQKTLFEVLKEKNPEAVKKMEQISEAAIGMESLTEV